MDSGEPWEKFAVLFRMNAQSRILEENLRRLQVPYRIVGGKSFFDRREVKDLIAYMSVLVNPDADADLLASSTRPARGISAATVDRALQWSVRRSAAFSRPCISGFARRVHQPHRGSHQCVRRVLGESETNICAPNFSNPASVMSAPN
jgi:superfamily I DNA/RNA helicase